MSWLSRLQQRLSITKNEALTLLSLSLLLLLGTVLRHACRQARPVSAEYYAEIDSLLAARSSAVLDPAADHRRRRDGGVSTGTEGSRDALDADSVPSYGGASSFDSTLGTVLQGVAVGTNPSDSDVPQNTTAQPVKPRLLQIDLNRATLQELDLLPRVGPRTAERIIAFREAYGSFRSVDELLSVSGIGPKTLEQIRPHVFVTADAQK